VISRLSIRDLENLSGVKAHTIRMWEKRYNIFEPNRTATNIRTYSHFDLKKLLNIATLLENGMKISKASSLRNEELLSEIESLYSYSEIPKNAFLTNAFIVATLRCDVASFENTYTLSIESLGLEQTIEQIIYPMLSKIGSLWSVNKLYPAQEHFASQMLRQKLFSAISALPQQKREHKFLLYLPDDENHEIGLLYGYYLIKKAGYECLYLGTNVPLDGVLECVTMSKPTHILTLFVTQRPEGKLSTYLEKIAHTFSNSTVLIGGICDGTCTIPRTDNIKLLSGINELKSLL
jgi:DNA-binding transcriptional MerR regulator